MADEITQYLDGYCHDHKHCTAKLAELCRWKIEHERIHREDQEVMRAEDKELHKKVDSQKTLLITALVALCLNLIATISKFI